jgi:hypothetical protein
LEVVPIGQNLPNTQMTGEVDAFKQYEPAGHTTGRKDELTQKEPAGHMIWVVDPASA